MLFLLISRRSFCVWTAEQHFKVDGARWYEFSIHSCPYLRHAYPSWLSRKQVNKNRKLCSALLRFFPLSSYIDSELCYRSPVADPNSKGVVFGMTLDTSEKQLALLYLATVQGIAYGTRHIVEHCNAQGHKVRFLLQALLSIETVQENHFHRNHIFICLCHLYVRLTHCLLVAAFQRTHCSSKNTLISLVVR